MVCVSPRHGDAGGGEVVVRLSGAAGGYQGKGARFDYVPTVQVLGVEPSFGRRSGGTMVTIVGRGLMSGVGMVCRFGGISVVMVSAGSGAAETGM
eukprot:1675113-Rhodomonas_salina.1